MVHARSWFGAAALLLSSSLLTVAPDAAQAAPSTDLTTAVTQKLLDRSAPGLRAAGKQDTRVTVTRRAGQGWASGTAVIVAPHEHDAYPAGRVFVARAQQAGGWQVALDGEAGFAGLAGAAPAEVVSGREKQVFNTPSPLSVGQDYRTGMRLPYTLGQSWQLSGGPHGWSGSDSPWSSIDLTGGDGRVLAAHGGTAYTMCKGWIRVIHDRGYATDYYHLWNNIDVDGANVDEGSYLGEIGTDVTCGGYADYRHVHFALRQNDEYVPIAGHDLGKWVFRDGNDIYEGFALHGSTRVNVDEGGLYNYGALGLDEGIVDADGGESVNKRSGPGTGYGVAGEVADGATVTISCSADGTTMTGRWGTTSLWDRFSDGTWVSDAYVRTGRDGPVAGSC